MEQNINDEALLAIKQSSFSDANPPKEKRRVFKGQTEFTLDYSTPEKLEASKRNRHFHQRMLRAYLKGAKQFNFGFKYVGNQRVHEVYEVLQSWE